MKLQRANRIVITRKQREIQERHELIVEKSRQLFVDKGYHSVTMDMIAKEMEYSKGTIYQHFPSKECIIMTLCSRFCTLMLNLIAFIANEKHLNPRLQITLVNEAFILLQDMRQDDVQLKLLADSQPFCAKVPSELSEESHVIEQKTFALVVGIVNSAIDNKQLKLKDNASAEFIALGGWGLAHGIYTLSHNGCASTFSNNATAKQLLRVNGQLYLDGVGWQAYKITEKRQLVLNEYQDKFRQMIVDCYPDASSITNNEVGGN